MEVRIDDQWRGIRQEPTEGALDLREREREIVSGGRERLNPREDLQSTCSWLLHCSPRLSLSLRSRAPPVAQRRGSRMGGRNRLLCCCVVYEASLAPPLRGHLLSRPFLRGGHRSSPAFADAVEGFAERVGPLSAAAGVPHDEHDDGDADDRQRKLHLGLRPHHEPVCLGWHFSGRQQNSRENTGREAKIR